jgi:hypothetical protein
MDRVHAHALAEILDDLPDALTGNAPGLLVVGGGFRCGRFSEGA